MIQRLIALAAVCCVLCACTACRIRVDLTDRENGGDASGVTTTTTAVSPPAANDEMAAEAWDIYSRALALEAEYTTYELTYKARMKVGREVTVTNARILRIETDGAVTLFVESEAGESYSSGYLKDGIGYFFLEGKKYWIPTDEDAFFETMGFSTTESLTEEMFGTAIVLRDAAGGATVSCPLAETYAADYAQMYLGAGAVQSGTVTRAEVGVTVTGEGHPTTFTSHIELYSIGLGAVSLQSENTYAALGDAVVITPPADLDSYTSIID